MRKRASAISPYRATASAPRLSAYDIDAIRVVHREARNAESIADLEGKILPAIRSGFDLSVCVLSHNPTGRSDIPYRVAFCGAGAEAEARYNAHYYRFNPLRGPLLAGDGGWRSSVVQFDLFADEAYRRSPLYCDFHRPLDMGYTMAIILTTDRYAKAVIGLWRPRRGGSFDAHDHLMAEMVEPALSAAYERLARRAPDDRAGRRAARLRALGLTAREADVVQAIASGWSNKETAMQLGITVFTVQDHIKSIYGKLDVHNRAALLNAIEPAA